MCWNEPDSACIEGVNNEPSHDTAQAAREEADRLPCDSHEISLLFAQVSARSFNFSDLTVGKGGLAAATTIDRFSETGCADTAHTYTRAISAGPRARRGGASPWRPRARLRALGGARLTHFLRRFFVMPLSLLHVTAAL